jgi:hypothetical protein
MDSKINRKEIFMNEDNKSKDQAFLDTVHNHGVFVESLMSGSLSCLPDRNGFTDTSPVFNIFDGTPYNGLTFLLLKKHQRDNGFPTAEYLTSEQIDGAKKDNPDVSIIKGTKGVSLCVSVKDPETGKWNDKNVTLFNAVQIFNSNKINKFPDYLSQYKPKGFFYCIDSSPEEYLGQYFAAVSMNRLFRVIPEQANEFSEKMKERLLEKTIRVKKDGETMSVPNPFTLSKICNDAMKVAKRHIKNALLPDPETEFYKSLEKQQEREQGQMQKQKHKRKL